MAERRGNEATLAAIKQREFAAGYQQALTDILLVLDEGGMNAVYDWIMNNRKDVR